MKEPDLQTSAVEQLATGFQFVEGPVWHKEGYWLFSDIPANRINKITPDGNLEVFREPSGNSNGLTLDHSGRLVACEHGNRRVSMSEVPGEPETLVDTFEDKRLNSPNDVVVHSNGSIYFTDPPYGILPDLGEIGFFGVYRVDTDGSITLLVSDFIRPNGLAFSPDESVLYIDDTENRHVRAFDVQSDGSLTHDRVFVDMNVEAQGSPDGLKVDVEGNLYITGGGGLWIVEPDGNHVGTVAFPELPSNVAFGGPDNCTIYVTARTSVFSIQGKVAGTKVW